MSDFTKAVAVAKSYTNKKIASMPPAFHIKEAVATYDDLPLTGNENGDVRETLDTGAEYYWDGTAWHEWGRETKIAELEQRVAALETAPLYPRG